MAAKWLDRDPIGTGVVRLVSAVQLAQIITKFIGPPSHNCGRWQHGSAASATSIS